MRAKGRITGYLTKDFGLIETDDHGDNNLGGEMTMVMFHVSDILLFREKVSKTRPREPIDKVVPAGLQIYFDARKIPTFRGIMYQAITIFAGKWPRVPHPTMLPGGPGSYVPCYDVPKNHTFFYLRLELNRKLQADLKAFRNRADNYGADLMHSEYSIESGNDLEAWRDRYVPPEFRGERPNPNRKRRRNYQEFKQEPAGVDYIRKEELKVNSQCSEILDYTLLAIGFFAEDEGRGGRPHHQVGTSGRRRQGQEGAPLGQQQLRPYTFLCRRISCIVHALSHPLKKYYVTNRISVLYLLKFERVHITYRMFQRSVLSAPIHLMRCDDLPGKCARQKDHDKRSV